MNKWLGFILLILSPFVVAKSPQLYGYGLKTCDHYRTTFLIAQQTPKIQNSDLMAYQNWLDGFISALNLATGRAVLVNMEWSEVSKKLALQCEDKRFPEFIDAVRSLIRLNSGSK